MTKTLTLVAAVAAVGTLADAARADPWYVRVLTITVRPNPVGAFVVQQPCRPAEQVERLIGGRIVFLCREVEEMWVAEEKAFARDLPAQRAIHVDPNRH